MDEFPWISSLQEAIPGGTINRAFALLFREVDNLQMSPYISFHTLQGTQPTLPVTPHSESHFTASEALRDVVIGMSDGLTMPFALAAGHSGAVASSGIVVTAGLAEIAAGAIAMGLGGYLTARSDAEHYASEYRREGREIVQKAAAERREVSHILTAYGLIAEEAAPVVEALSRRPKQWVEFMMKFELALEPTDPKRAHASGLTIGGA